MFRTGLLSIRSLVLYTEQWVFVKLVMLTASEILLADSQHNQHSNTYCCVYSVETPDDGQ